MKKILLLSIALSIGNTCKSALKDTSENIPPMHIINQHLDKNDFSFLQQTNLTTLTTQDKKEVDYYSEEIIRVSKHTGATIAGCILGIFSSIFTGANLSSCRNLEKCHNRIMSDSLILTSCFFVNRYMPDSPYKISFWTGFCAAPVADLSFGLVF